MIRKKYLLLLTSCVVGLTSCGGVAEPDAQELATIQVLIEGKLTLTAAAGYSPTPTVTLTPAATATPTITLTPTPPPTPLGGGGQIAFASNHEGNFDIYTMDLEGGAPTRVTENLFNDNEPAWSPDGQSIVYVSSTSADNRGVYSINSDGSGRRLIATFPVAEGGSPTWSSKGRIAYWAIKCTSFCDKNGYHRSVIWIIEPNGDVVTSLQPFISTSFLDTAWTPDGTQLTVLNGTDWSNSIELITPDGDFGQRFSKFKLHRDQAWSPDGSTLAFSSNEEGNYNIYILYADGTYFTRLTAGIGDNRHPTWSPDGTQIAFSSNRGGNWDIYVITLDKSRQKRLTTDTTDEIEPSWRP
jgi:Tol biopolymer transport system component